jgi:CheY-like chemotaxis protein
MSTHPNGVSPHADGRSVEILLVEDDRSDIRLVQEALQEGRVLHHLHVVRDGVEALAFLRGEGSYASAILPDLILLDLKMPKKGGLEVLREIKDSEALRRIPVIVLTTSDAPEDVAKAYELQASLYVTKPSDLEEFDRMLHLMRDFCLTVVMLPPRA